MSAETDITDFAKTLKTLTTNDKYIINTLSVMAMNARENPTMSKEIAKLAMGNIFKVTSGLKLPSFYVVDSIIKNVGSPYKDMFAEKVLEAFVHTFQSNKDHKIRIKLYNLRLTWKEFFPPDLMNNLDEEVKKLDPAWPLVQKFNPKYKSTDKKPETNNDNSAKSSPDSTTPTVNRDPRIVKIVKPEKEIERKRPSNEELFTIDREGEEHVKKLLNKKPKVEPKVEKESPTDLLFGSKDMDLRIPPAAAKNWTSEDVFKILNKNENISIEFSNTPANPEPAITLPPQPALPQPREPTWKVKIEGFPQMPQIGTDPRLLARCPFYDPSRTITIDGAKYMLHLDRIQPCIFVNTELHAVRFYCHQNMELIIDNIPFEISANGLAHIKINRRFYIATLGGPGHELIINGWPYNVRIDGNMHQITVSGYPVSVQFIVQRPVQVNVQTAIPPFVCDWAVKGFFGSAQYLNIAPLNPLRNIKLQDPQAFQFRGELSAIYDRRNQMTAFPVPPLLPNNMIGIPVANTVSDQIPPAPQLFADPAGVATKPPSTVANPIDVHDLFQKLVATGIIMPNVKPPLQSTNITQPINITNAPTVTNGIVSVVKINHDSVLTKLDITRYSWDLFKHTNEREIIELYSGHQCDLCGTRFKNKDSKEFELHLDYHFYKNTTSLTSTRKGRNYVLGSRQWVLGGTVRANEPDFSFDQATNFEQKFKCPMFEVVERNKCAVCMEGFEVAWDDEEEAFMLQDGQIHNDKVYHPICLEDADKQNQEDRVIAEADKSQIELTNQPLAALQKVLQGKMDSVVLPETAQSESDYKSNQSEQEFDYESAIS